MYVTNPKKIGLTIAKLRKEKGWSQRALAGHTNGSIKTTQLSNYEQGIRTPGVEEVAILANALGVTPGFIAGYTKIRVKLAEVEIELIQAYRRLPENERNDYFRRIKALSMAYQEPVPDERLAHIKAPHPASKDTVK